MTRTTLCLVLLACGCQHRAAVPDDDGGPPGSRVADGQVTVTPDATAVTCKHKLLGGPVTVSQKGTSNMSPSVAASGKGFGVIWLASITTAHPLVRMRVASRSAKLIGVEADVGPESHAWAEIAHDGKEYGLCWHTDPAMKSRISFRRLSNAGAFAGKATVLSTEYSHACTALAAGHGGWVATLMGMRKVAGVWQYRHALYIMDRAGKVTAGPAPFIERSNPSALLSLVSTSVGHFAAYRTTDSESWDVMVQRFTGAGKVAGPPVRIVTKGKSTYSRLIWTGKRLLLAYLQATADGDHRVMLRRLDDTGKPLGQPMTVSAAGVASSLDATWTGAAVALAWFWAPRSSTTLKPPQYRVQLARLRGDGAPLQPVVDLHTVQTTAPARTQVAGDGQRVAVTWQERVGTATHARLAVTGCPPM